MSHSICPSDIWLQKRFLGIFCSRQREFGGGRDKICCFITLFIVRKATKNCTDRYSNTNYNDWFTLSPSSPGEPLGPAGPGSPTGPCIPSRPAGPWGPFSPWFWRKWSNSHYHRRVMKIAVQGITVPIQNEKTHPPSEKSKKQWNRKHHNRKKTIKGRECIRELCEVLMEADVKYTCTLMQSGWVKSFNERLIYISLWY